MLGYQPIGSQPLGAQGTVEPGLTDYLGLSDAADGVEAITDAVSDTLSLLDVLTDIQYVLHDTVGTSDAIDGSDGAAVLDRLGIQDSFTGHLQVSSGVTSSLSVTDVLEVVALSSSFDTLGWSDQINSDLEGVTDDALSVVDGLAAQLSATLISVDTLGTADSIALLDLVGAVEALSVSDDLSSVLATFGAPLVDQLACDANTWAAIQFEGDIAELVDTVVLAETAASQLTLVGILSDATLAGDTLSEESFSVVVVVNAKTGAVSEYVVSPTVTGLAEFRGILYLVGPTGLYALDAVDDETGAVVWEVRTGYSSMGSDTLKRIRDVNAQLWATGPVVLETVSDWGGHKKANRYQSPNKGKFSYQNHVIKVGGHSTSAFWQLALMGSGPAELAQMDVAIIPLDRRR